MCSCTASQQTGPVEMRMPVRQILRDVSDRWQACVAEGDITGRSKCCRPVQQTLLLPAALWTLDLKAHRRDFRSPQAWTVGSRGGPRPGLSRATGNSNVLSGARAPSDIDSASHSAETGCILPRRIWAS